MSPIMETRVNAMLGIKVSICEFEMYVGGAMTESLAFQIKSNKNDMEEIENLQRRIPWSQSDDADETGLENGPRHPRSWLSDEDMMVPENTCILTRVEQL
jgi:hypothetical protein